MAICRECGAELIPEETWYPSLVKKNWQICIKCLKARTSQWRTKNPKRAAEQQQRWRKKNPAYHREYSRQWVKRYPEKVREKRRLRRAQLASATIEPVDEQRVRELYNHTCIYCGSTEDLTLDHVIPLAGVGAHCEDNLVVACRRCNSSKKTKPLAEWLYTQPRARAWVA